jgi:hopanoid biosynthesis associated RND transporter like protein HpnN
MNSTLLGRSRLAKTVGRLVRFSCRWYLAVILFCTLLSALAAGFTARHIAIDTDSDKLFRADLPFRKNQAAIDQAFPQKNDLIAVVIDGATPELAEAAAAGLAKRLQARSDLFRIVRRPDAGPFFERNGLLFLSVDEVSKITQQLIKAEPMLGSLAADPSLRGLMNTLGRLLDGVAHGDAKLADIDRPLAALADSLAGAAAGKAQPFSWQAMISGEKPGNRTLRRFILVQPMLSYGKLEPGGEATAAIRAAAADLGLSPDHGVRVRLTGSVPLADEEFATLAEGAARNGVLTLIAVVGLLWLCLRSARIIVAILITLLVGLLSSAAFGILAVGAFNLISIAFAVLFVGLGVDLAIQFSIRYRAERHDRGDLENALVAAGTSVGSSLALAAASIAAGFFAFLPTDYRGVSELGLIAGSGMLIAFLLSVTLLPALLTLLRPPGEPAPVGFAALAPVDRFLARHRRAALVTAGLVALSCLALLPALRFDFNPLNLRSPKVESVSTLFDLMKDPNETPNTIEILAPSLASAQQLADRLGALPEVAQTVTLASFVPKDQDQKLALIADAAQLLSLALDPLSVKPGPSDAETIRAMNKTATALRDAAADGESPAARGALKLADALSALAEGSAGNRQKAGALLIPGLEVTLAQLRQALQAGPVSLASLPTDLVRDWTTPDGRAKVEAYPTGDQNDNETLARFVAAVRAIAPDATGAPVSIQASSRTVVGAFVEAGALALAAITLLLLVVLRRLADTLLTLAPLFLAGLLTLAVSVLIGLPLNFANIIALPLLFGIGVAFNIYFVMVWRRGGTNFLQSSLTRAILFSALTTTAAFGSLCFSNHPGTASMGLLLALSLGCTLVSALLFLPALLGPPRTTPKG